jgi:hypothetical protein
MENAGTTKLRMIHLSYSSGYLKGTVQQELFAHPFSCERPLSVDAISYKIWDMVNQFPITVHTYGSGLFLTPY